MSCVMRCHESAQCPKTSFSVLGFKTFKGRILQKSITFAFHQESERWSIPFSCSKTSMICIDTECESASRVKAKPSTSFWGLSRGLLGCCRKLWKIRLKSLNMLSWLHHIISVYIHLVHGPASWGHVSKSKFGGSCGASGLLLSLLAHRAAKS